MHLWNESHLTYDSGWRRLTGSLIFIRYFRKSDLYLVALLWKMICNSGDPMSLRRPVLLSWYIRLDTSALTYLPWYVCLQAFAFINLPSYFSLHTSHFHTFNYVWFVDVYNTETIHRERYLSSHTIHLSLWLHTFNFIRLPCKAEKYEKQANFCLHTLRVTQEMSYAAHEINKSSQIFAFILFIQGEKYKGKFFLFIYLPSYICFHTFAFILSTSYIQLHTFAFIYLFSYNYLHAFAFINLTSYIFLHTLALVHLQWWICLHIYTFILWNTFNFIPLPCCICLHIYTFMLLNPFNFIRLPWSIALDTMSFDTRALPSILCGTTMRILCGTTMSHAFMKWQCFKANALVLLYQG